MKDRKIPEEKLNPPALDVEEGLEDEEILQRAMSGVQPMLDRGRTGGRLRTGRRRQGSGRPPTPPEQPLIEFMQDERPIESHLHPDYVEGGALRWDRRLIRKLRRGGFSIQETLDLHGLTQDEARSEIEVFLHEARARGFSCVRIVHGKGRNSPNNESVLKRKVPEWLLQKRLARFVLAFTSAPQRDGGSGATYVLIRRDRVGGEPKRDGGAR